MNNRAEWHITYRCQLACIGCNRACFLPATTPDMTLAHGEEFVRQCRELDWHPDIVFLGGEPTLHPDFHQFVKLALDNFENVEVYSNAYGTKTQAVLADLDKRIVPNQNTRKPKGSAHHEHNDMFLAPADFGEHGVPCKFHSSGSVGCGISVDAGGYTACGSGGAIAGVLGLDLRTKQLADLFDREFYEGQTAELCKWCGLTKGYRGGHEPILYCSHVSKTWREAIERIKCTR